MPAQLLVTGGAGFIGSHLVRLLLDEGYAVRVLDNLSYGNRDWLDPRATFLEGDVQDIATCHSAMRDVQGVFHMAAMSRSAASLDSIELCTNVNVVGTQNVLLAAREAKVEKVVYSGSSTYYGSRPVPHTEGDPGDFLNFYGLSKYVGEEYCLLFDRLYNLPTVVLRYFNVYGPRQPEVGAYALVLGVFLRQAQRGQTLEIHGDGSQRRDFVHVEDVARANLAAFRSPERGQVFNIGSGESVSIQELADLISSQQVRGPRRVADSTETLASLTKTRSRLGWEPQVPFATGLADLQARMSKSAADESAALA